MDVSKGKSFEWKDKELEEALKFFNGTNFFVKLIERAFVGTQCYLKHFPQRKSSSEQMASKLYYKLQKVLRISIESILASSKSSLKKVAKYASRDKLFRKAFVILRRFPLFMT